MFVETTIDLRADTAIVALPASSVNHAPYGDSVFVVEDMKDPKGKSYKGVRQQFVKLGAGRGDQVAIVTGVKSGDEVVSSGVFKLRNGAAVQVTTRSSPEQPEQHATEPGTRQRQRRWRLSSGRAVEFYLAVARKLAKDLTTTIGQVIGWDPTNHLTVGSNRSTPFSRSSAVCIRI